MVCVAFVVFARYGHPLRFYITPHFVKWSPVAALKLRLVPVTASRPPGLQNRRYAKWPSLETSAQPSALPGRWHALRAAICAPLWVCACTCALVRRCALCCRLVACGQSSCVCPRPPGGLAAARLWPCAGSARPPPRGSLSPAPGVTPPNGGGSKTSNLWCKSMYRGRYSAGIEHPRKKPAIF